MTCVELCRGYINEKIKYIYSGASHWLQNVSVDTGMIVRLLTVSKIAFYVSDTFKNMKLIRKLFGKQCAKKKWNDYVK